MQRRRRKYRCKHCQKVVLRTSDKQWVKSWCCKTDREVHLTLITKPVNQGETK